MQKKIKLKIINNNLIINHYINKEFDIDNNVINYKKLL